jgi:hypothetical protein
VGFCGTNADALTTTKVATVTDKPIHFGRGRRRGRVYSSMLLLGLFLSILCIISSAVIVVVKLVTGTRSDSKFMNSSAFKSVANTITCKKIFKNTKEEMVLDWKRRLSQV